MAKYNQEVECAWCGSTLSPGTEFCKFCNKLQPTGVAAEDASFDQIEKMQESEEKRFKLRNPEPKSNEQRLILPIGLAILTFLLSLIVRTFVQELFSGSR